MYSLTFLSLCLSGVSMLLLLLLLAPGSDAERLDPTPPLDYDYNATFDYSFFSNTSSEDLDRFSERFGKLDEEEEAMVTPGGSTESDDAHDTASLPLSQEIWMLIWSLMILKLQQHTL